MQTTSSLLRMLVLLVWLAASGPASASGSTTRQHHPDLNLSQNLTESLSQFLIQASSKQQQQASSLQQQHQSGGASNNLSVGGAGQQQPQTSGAANNKSPRRPAPSSGSSTTTTSSNLEQEISCDELNLIVLAQKLVPNATNGNAASRFIECKRIDPSLASKSTAAQAQTQAQKASAVAAAAAAAATVRHSNGTTAAATTAGTDSLAATPAHERRASPASEFNAGDGGGAGVTYAALVEQSGSTELHFGAKVALSILLAITMLVLSATLVDLHVRRQREDNNDSSESRSKYNQHHSHFSFQQQHHNTQNNLQQQQQQLRDRRSPSLSSSCSSSLFCSSANSVASASAPILRNNATGPGSGLSGGLDCSERSCAADDCSGAQRRRDAWFKFNGGPPTTTTTTKPGHHYVLNLQMLFGDTMSAGSAAEHWRSHRHSVDGARSGGGHSDEPAAQTNAYQPISWSSLARQLFLAFSLRNSASLIFHHTSNQRGDHNASPGHHHCGRTDNSGQLQRRGKGVVLAAGHRSRVSSLSSINESSASLPPSHLDVEDTQSQGHAVDEKVASAEDHHFGAAGEEVGMGQPMTLGRHQQQNLHHYQQQQPQCHCEQTTTSARSRQPESIDSLHGLRFLSMIWIIAIHSYDFALRWSFFKNTSSLDNIYKTAASQLLANGTFACDSFFFASGFLLPYLAFPAQSNKNNQHTGRGSSSGSIDSSSSLTSHHRSLEFLTAAAQTTTTTAASKESKCDGGSKQQQQQLDSCLPRSNCSSPDCCLATTAAQQPDSLCSSSPSNSSCDSRQSAGLATSGLAPHQHQHQQQQQQGTKNNSQQQQVHYYYYHHHHHHHQHHSNNCTGNGKQQPATGALRTNELHEFTFSRLLGNLLHRYVRMMPLMMAIIGLSATLLRYLGEGPAWDDSTMMFDKWCRKNWWINALFLHNFWNRENMCLSHSWYSAVDIQLFLLGQLILFILFRSRKFGIFICCTFLFGAQLITGALTLMHHLPAVPLIASVSEQSLNLYYGEIYIKPYCRASPYLIGILLAYLMRTTRLGQVRLKKWQVVLGWTAALGTLSAILLAMQPAMNGQAPSELQSALYSALSRPLWACATGWMIFACITKHGGIFNTILAAPPFIPLSRLTYPAFLIHPIVMALFYGSRQSSFHFSHYLMLYLILGNIVITYAGAFLLSALFELPLLTAERAIKRAWAGVH